MRKLSTYGPSLLVIATAALLLVATPEAVHRLTYAKTSARIIRASERLQHENVLEQINQAYRDIAAFVEPSVVHITAHRASREPLLSGQRLSSGSGWVYDSHGHVVTNHHVVEDATRIDVQLYSGEIRPAELLGSDPTTDIAVLKIAPHRLHPAARRSPGAPVQQGDMVFTFGSPFDFRFSMSSGVVSGQGRSVGVIRTGSNLGFENFIQVDAAINPGNSGGPLTDFRGHVIGMNTAIATGARWSLDGVPNLPDEGQFGGVGLAIPIEMIEPVVSQLIATGTVKKGFVGIRLADRTHPVQAELQAAGFRGSGALVAASDPDFPALDGSLLTSDVITRLNGLPVRGRSELLARIAALQPDRAEAVELTVWRFNHETLSGGRESITLTHGAALLLAELPLVDQHEPIARRLELLDFARGGVPITGVDRDGPAHHAGVRRGDVITHVNGQPVGEVGQVQAIISSVMPEQTAMLRVWRYDDDRGDGAAMEIPITVGQLDPVRLSGMLPIDHDAGAIEALGIARMATLTPQLAGELGLAFQPGIVLLEIMRGTDLGQRARPGAIVVRVSDRPVTTTEELIAALSRIDLRRGAHVGIVNPDGSYIIEVLRVR